MKNPPLTFAERDSRAAWRRLKVRKCDECEIPGHPSSGCDVGACKTDVDIIRRYMGQRSALYGDVLTFARGRWG